MSHRVWRAALAAIGCSLALSAATAALGAWSAHGAGTGAGAAAVMPAGKAPVATATGTSVVVSWPAVTFANGSAVEGYTIQRTNASTGTIATTNANCNGTVTTTTCTELAVPTGSWTYTDTPVQQNWSGAQSPASTPVAVSG